MKETYRKPPLSPAVRKGLLEVLSLVRANIQADSARYTDQRHPVFAGLALIEEFVTGVAVDDRRHRAVPWALVESLDFVAVGIAGVLARFTSTHMRAILHRWGYSSRGGRRNAELAARVVAAAQTRESERRG